MTQYQCSACGLAVIVLNQEKPIRACSCDAPITANMQAHAYGSGGVAG